MDQTRRRYPSDLTDWQWEIIKELVPPARSGGRKRTTDIRSVLNAIFYINRTGMAWRYLPTKDFPPWKTVYDYFSRWSKAGLWDQFNQIFSRALRIKAQRNPLPTLGIVDSQSVRAQYGEQRGWDGFKKVRGRKRQIIVDTMGFILGCEVHPANLRDPHGAVRALEKTPQAVLESLEVILGDAAYVGPFDEQAWLNYDIKVERKKASKEESNLKPKRWIVERTFAWFNNFRRLSRDYERIAINSEAMIYIAMLSIMLNRLAT